MTDDIARLIEKLKGGWAPDATMIDVPQYDVLGWGWSQDDEKHGLVIAGEDADGMIVIADVLWIDAYLGWAVIKEGFCWLYIGEEVDKVRYLGG